MPEVFEKSGLFAKLYKIFYKWFWSGRPIPQSAANLRVHIYCVPGFAMAVMRRPGLRTSGCVPLRGETRHCPHYIPVIPVSPAVHGALEV